jgi:hypothetical protein
MDQAVEVLPTMHSHTWLIQHLESGFWVNSKLLVVPGLQATLRYKNFLHRKSMTFEI